MRILQKERAVRNWPKLYRKGEDILLHKQSAKKYRDDQLNFLENYSRRYLVSDEFYDCAKASINNRYIYDLYFPMVNKQILRKDIPEGYFDEDLRVTNSLSRLYITALWYLYIYNYTEDIYNNFDLVYNHIINDFEGDERAYLMSAMIGLFASKNSTSYSEQLLNAIEKASQYTQNEIEYNTESKLSLKDVLQKYEGKAVYIDFWASWCMPCLKEIPKMKEVYKKYNEKGLTIIGISLDRVKDSWSEAIRKNNLNVWPQILSSETNEKDEKENNLSYLYNCDAIPFYVLIDKEGKVVAKWEHIGDVQLKELDMLIK